MIPIAPIVIIVIALVRTFAESPTNTTGQQVTVTSRASANVWHDPYVVRTALWQLFVVPAAIGGWLLAILDGSLWSLATAIPATICAFPDLVARRILVPLGLVRSAFYVSRLARHVWRHDRPGGSVLVGALALLRHPNPPPKLLEFLEERLQRTEATARLQASNVVAAGFVAALRDRRDEARRLFESTGLFSPKVAPPFVRAYAIAWLCADAAARGQWARVAFLVEEPGVKRTGAIRLFAALADAHRGEPIAAWRIRLAWLLAGRWAWTKPFVEQTVEHLRAGTLAATTRTGNAPPASDPIAHALGIQVALGEREATLDELVDLARAWDRVFTDASLPDRLSLRATLNGGGNALAALDELRLLVEDELAERLPADLDGLPADVPDLLVSATAANRDTLYERLERAVERLPDVGEGPAAIDAWRSIALIHEAYGRLVKLGERDLAFSVIATPVVNFGAELYNDLGERPAANAIFAFLAAEAERVGDAEALRLNSKNADCAF